MDRVWTKTIRHLLRRDFDVRRCLVLGVAMGATFGVVQKAWPDADIVGIDWEPALFELGKKIGIFHPTPRVTFVEGDAAAEVPRLEGKFDLIIIDLFNGRNVADAVSDAAFRIAVTDHLSENGVIALNCYFQRHVAEEWPGRLGSPTFVHYEANDVGILGPSEVP
jgi:spermidine synthase